MIWEEKESKLETIWEEIVEEAANDWRGQRRVSGRWFAMTRRGSRKQVVRNRSRGSSKGVATRQRVRVNESQWVEEEEVANKLWQVEEEEEVANELQWEEEEAATGLQQKEKEAASELQTARIGRGK